MLSKAIMVENGTAPDDRFPQMKKFNRKQTRPTTDGYIDAVINATFFHCVPFIVLYIRPA
jgi:hypothetical protein